MPRINNKYEQRTTELEKFANAEQLVAPDRNRASLSHAACRKIINGFARESFHCYHWFGAGTGCKQRAFARVAAAAGELQR